MVLTACRLSVKPGALLGTEQHSDLPGRAGWVAPLRFNDNMSDGPCVPGEGPPGGDPERANIVGAGPVSPGQLFLLSLGHLQTF